MEYCVISQCLLLAFLGAAALMDLRKKQLPVCLIAAGFLAGFFMQVAFGRLSLFELAAGCLPGAVVLLLAFLSRQRIGYGDGLILLMSGVYLGLFYNVLLLLVSLTAAAGTGFLLLRLKRIGRSHPLPFVPFLLAGYVGILCLL